MYRELLCVGNILGSQEGTGRKADSLRAYSGCGPSQVRVGRGVLVPYPALHHAHIGMATLATGDASVQPLHLLFLGSLFVFGSSYQHLVKPTRPTEH